MARKTVKPVVVCLPTFCELAQIKKVLKSFNHVGYPIKEVIVVNANYGDQTTSYLSKWKKLSRFELTEIEGKPSEYWSATINRGLSYINRCYGSSTFILMCNVDITFRDDILSKLLKRYSSLNHECILGALADSQNGLISSGVIVRSWLFPINNMHPFEGQKKQEILDFDLVEVDFLPGRCILIPPGLMCEKSLMKEYALPHYHADYEFSKRISKEKGARLYIDPSVVVYVDVNNTGISIINKNLDLSDFFANFFGIKHVSNIKYRLAFAAVTFPWYAKLTAMFAYFLKSCADLMLGLFFLVKKK